MAMKQAGARQAPSRGRIDWTAVAALSAILAVFVFQAVSLNFTQDDAYISFRYVKNLIAGHGLVFNPGQRVEGYTNFLWIMIIALFAGLGLDPVMVSKVLGVASGCLSVVVLYEISKHYFGRAVTALASTAGGRPAHPGFAGMTPDEIRLLALSPPLLLASNGAFAYWSISGLETSLFVLGVLTTLYCYLSDMRLAVAAAATTSLVRPEGVLIFAILMLYSLIARRESVGRVALSVMGFALLTLPFLVFRLLYYGDLLPNPFYAKTGLSPDYLRSGLGYFWNFLRDYGLMGLLYLVPILMWRRLRTEGRTLLVTACVYSLYVILVGGDVLRGHRFLLPAVPLLYVLIVFSIGDLTVCPSGNTFRRTAWIGIVIAIAAATFAVPQDSILEARRYELGLNAKLAKYARVLNGYAGSDVTIAVPTIGVISYLTDAKVIDMLGLTDPHIAKDPERIPGLTSTWKERRFNSGYLLSQDPDFIMFSTGYKPSALAEKALFLHSRFRQDYYLYFFKDFRGRSYTHLHVYKRKGRFRGTDKVFPDPTFVDLYAKAVHLYSNEHEYDAAIRMLRRMFRVMPDDFARGYEFMGTCYFFKGDADSARSYALKAVEMDDYSVEAHTVLHDLYVREGAEEAAQRQTLAIRRYNPEVLQRPPD